MPCRVRNGIETYLEGAMEKSIAPPKCDMAVLSRLAFSSQTVRAAPQVINGGAGFLIGGENQVFIKREDLNPKWFKKRIVNVIQDMLL